MWRVVIVVVLGLVLEVDRAEACSCGAAILYRPHPQETDVPLNVALVLETSWGGYASLELRDALTQTPIPLVVEPFPAHGWLQYAIARPATPLSPFTKYEVTDGFQPQEFTTGDAIDDTPPAAFELRSIKATNIEAQPMCFDCDGPTDHADFSLDFDGNRDLFTTFEYYKQGEPSGVVAPTERRGVGLFCTRILPAIDPMATYCARVTAYDIAGHATVSNEVCTVGPAEECTFADKTDCDSKRECKPAGSSAPDSGGGCSTGANAGWLVGVLIGLALRRRR